MNNAPKRKKSQRQDLYVTLIVIFMMIAVIVAISVSLAKNTGKIEDSPETTEKAGVVSDPLPTPDKDEDEDPTLDTEDVFLNDGEDTKKPEKDTEDTEKTDPPAKEEKEDAAVIPDFIAPVRGELLKGCSLDTPVFSLTMEDYRTHPGIDLYCTPGSDVAAVARGTVKEIWDDPMMGTCISVEHPGGAVSVYKNLCEDIPGGIGEGSAVSPGQVIATAGDTALLELAEESHLHFELYIGGEAVDPCEYIDISSEPVFSE